MILNFIYLILTLAYFSAVISYTYDIEANCDCEVRWYLDYVRYFSIVYITLTIVIFLYIILLILSYNSTHIWYNNIARYIILFTLVVKSVGMIIFFYCFYSFNTIVLKNKQKCGCYRNKFFDIITIATHVYLGVFILTIIKVISQTISNRKKRIHDNE